MAKTLPARLYASPESTVEFRRRYDTNEARMAEVRRVRAAYGCRSCVRAREVLGKLICAETGCEALRTCSKYWTNI